MVRASLEALIPSARRAQPKRALVAVFGALRKVRMCAETEKVFSMRRDEKVLYAHLGRI